MSKKENKDNNSSGISVKPSQMVAFLRILIQNGLPGLVTSAPGIGKSSLVAEAVLAEGADLILSHPVVSDPTDAKGLPWIGIDKETATFLPFGDLAKAIKATKRTVWFLDDLGQASPAVQASYMQLLLAREVNGHKLPDCVTFIAATNKRTDRAGVTGILEPVKSRFASIVELEANLDDWCNWYLGQDLPPEIVAFMRFRPDLLSDFKPTADLTQSPSPRAWEYAAKLLKAGVNRELEFPVLSGAVGQGAATELCAFLQTYRALPNLDGILLDPDKSDIPQNPAALYAVATGLAHRANPDNFDRIARYASRLHTDKKGEFAVLLIRDSMRRAPEITTTKAFVKLASQPVGKLIVGGY